MALRFGRQDGGFVSGLLFAAQTAFVSGIFGSGAREADASTVAGPGTREIVGSGALQAQAASASGSGVREVVDLGTPPELEAQDSTVSGEGSVSGVIEASGALAAGDATVSGTGARGASG